MTKDETVEFVRAINDVKFDTATLIKQLIYKYGIEDTGLYSEPCICISRDTIDAIFDILAPEKEPDKEYVRRHEQEDDEEDETENE